LQYLDAVLAETLKDTPAEKISLGVPFYCWQYEIGNGGKIASVTYEISKNTQEKYEDNGVFSLYLDSLGAEIFAFVKDTGRVNYIWCDNRESVETKNNIVKDKGLRGMSFWALGQEDPDIWKDL
jgi:spore germination protein